MEETWEPYDFRWARPEEWDETMEMVWKTFLKFDACDYTQEGIKNFRDFITDEALHQAFLNGKYRVLIALDGDRIIGAASLRNINHLSLLFVDEEYHLRGVGRALMERLCLYLRDGVGERYMSLKASPYAVDFYKKLGFQVIRPEENYDGIRVTSMEKVF